MLLAWAPWHTGGFCTVPTDSPGSGKGSAFLGHWYGLGEPGGQVTRAVSGALLPALGQQDSLFLGQPGLVCYSLGILAERT